MKSIIVTLCLLVGYSFAHDLKEPLVINCGFKQPEATLIMDVVQAVFKEAKLPLKMQILPNKRSVQNANEGIDDGDATRIWHINKYYPNLHRVPIETSHIDIVAITHKKLMLKKLTDIKPYNIGVVRGMKIVEVKAEELHPKSLIKVDSHKTLIQMLINHRIDVALADKGSLIQVIKRENIKGLYLLQKPLMVLPMYIHLHKKHKNLIPRLTQAAQTLNSKGVLAKIYEDFDKKFNSDPKRLITKTKND